MPIGMPQSRILTPHKPRRYGLPQVIDITEHGADASENRWAGGSSSVEFHLGVTTVDLLDCDFEVEEWESEANTATSRVAFASTGFGKCSTLSGPDALEALRANVQAEHRALLPFILENELILGASSGETGQSLAGLSTAVDPGADVRGTDLVGVAESLGGEKYEVIILVPIGLWAGVADGAAFRDGGVWRTAAGNLIAPQAADDDVYVIPAPITLDIKWGNGPESGVERTHNDVEVHSTFLGLFEIHHEVVAFTPSS